MKVLFIVPFLNMKKIMCNIPLGICYLSSCLKKYGHQTKLFLVNSDLDYKKLDVIMGNFKPEVILISALTYEINVCKDVIIYLSNKYRLPIFIGGVHPTLVPEQVIKLKGVSGVCIGEGEYSVVRLVNSLEKKEGVGKIPGIWIKKNYKLIRTPPIKLGNINKLPFPDRSLFAEHNFDAKQIPILASRGCPYACTMCSNHSIRDIYENKEGYYRIRTVKNVIAEAKFIKSQHGQHVLFFANDKFPLYDPWLKEFSKQYSSQIGTPFKCKLSIIEIKKNRIKLLKEAGCIQIKIGVESGNEKMLGLIKKNTTIESILKACQIIKSQGIKLFCWYMVGLPYETENSIKDTINLHKKIHPDIAEVSTFTPLPNTPLYELCIKEKFIDAWKPSNYGDNSILNLPALTNGKLQFYKEYLITLSQIPSLALLFYIFFKLSIKNRLAYRLTCFLRKILYAIRLRIPYNFYRKYSLQY